MRTKPIYTYSGLTVVLQHPSRMDDRQLLSHTAGFYFNNECLVPYCNRFQCDIRTSDTIGEGLLPNTKAILLLGERAFQEWTIGYKDYTLNEQRGNLLDNKFNLPCIASYFPQDCQDVVDHESKFNIHMQAENAWDGGEEENEDFAGKRHGKTNRANFRFWLKADTRKLLTKIFDSSKEDGLKGRAFSWLKNLKNSSPTFHLYPPSKETIDFLGGTKNGRFHLDIETDSARNITCFGCSFDHDVFVIPFIRFGYSSSYSNLPRILQAIAGAMKQNEVIVHNSMFDLVVLSWKYRMPVGARVYDTMLAQHKLFPEIEKSLGHCLSLFTWEPFHKDEGVFEPQNEDQEHKLWKYNAKDVWGMRLVREAQDFYSSGNPGLRSSIELANNTVRPYLINTLLGIHYDQNLLDSYVKMNDRWMTQYLRMLRILLGEVAYKEASRGSDKPMPLSNKQCITYFHEMLGYPKVKTSKKTGKPSLDADAIFKLKLKHPNNPALDLVIKFREKSRESGSLKFNPWRT